MPLHCRFDEGAVFDDPFTPDDVSKRDYFHPSIRGQRRLAQMTWPASFDFTDQAPPIFTAVTIVAEDRLVVTLEAADDTHRRGPVGEFSGAPAPYNPSYVDIR